MMELSLSLQEHLNRSAILHSKLCPRQVLGVRMARLACTLLGVDPRLHRKSIYVYMETGHCAADGVMVVTGASPTNGLMRLVAYGKLAATFVCRKSGEAIRVSERYESRDIAVQMMPDVSRWEAQLAVYQIMPDHELFRWEWVLLKEIFPLMKAKHSATCHSCGDRISDHAERVVDGQTLCQVCAVGGYFIPLKIIPPSDVVPSPDHPAYSHS
jgi:formylmethanofuran dehydrogenase subunit E